MGAKPKVLIVEDDLIVQSSLERLLRGNDCDVDCADSGEEGLEKFTDSPCDLVVADLRLPGIDGIEMVDRMRKVDDSLDFVVMSAYGCLEDAIRALRLGALDFFQKPFDANQIVNLTHNVNPHDRRKKANPKKEKKSSKLVSEDNMKTAEKPVRNKLAKNLSPEVIQLQTLLAPFISIGRQGTGITHNLNSPLTGLMGHLELMKLKNPELTNDLDIIMGLAKKLRDSIANLQLKFEVETIRETRALNVNEILRTTLANLQADLFFKHYIRRDVDFQESLPFVEGIYADFALAFEEILLNAIDAQRDQKEGYIGVKTYSDDKVICVEIEDDGAGFSDEALDNAFEPFWPEMKSQEDGKVHVGMGLFLSLTWLQNYGGHIELENRPTKGARIRVTLPHKG